MGLETGTRIVDLVATNPVGSDDRSTADDHLRLIKTCARSLINAVPGAAAAQDYTIASGVITPTVSGTCYLIVESGSSDTLDHIATTNCPDGSVVRLRASDPNKPITVVDSSTGDGHIRPRGGYSMLLNHVDAYIDFQLLGTIWREIGRAGDYQKAVDRIESIDRTVGITEYAFALPTQDYLHFEFELRRLQINAVGELRIQFSQDGGSSWLGGSTDYNANTLQTYFGGNIAEVGINTVSGLLMAGSTWPASRQLHGTVKVYPDANAIAVGDIICRGATFRLFNTRSQSFLIANGNPINAVRFLGGDAGQQFLDGAITMYGWL